MEAGRGTQMRLVDASLGTVAIDLHVNRLRPGGARGRVHRHTKSDNIYIVRHGEGTLTIEGETHLIRTDDVVFIPAGTPHSLSNLSGEPLELFEIDSTRPLEPDSAGFKLGIRDLDRIFRA